MANYYLEEYADTGLYIMQGRLSSPEDGYFQCFPRNSWMREIDLAPQIPLRGIEWIYDQYGEGGNPLETEEGRISLNSILTLKGVKVVSVCADYFMERPLLKNDSSKSLQQESRLKWLISICPSIGIKRIVLPFVDASRLVDTLAKGTIIQILHNVLPLAREVDVEIHLETDMGPKDFSAFLRDVLDPLVKVNYDSGNSAALGYNPSQEFAAYGERIGSFHIKDRVLGGGTVPLGEGNTDFKSLRAALLDVDYRGDFVLQVARGVPGEEFRWIGLMNARACQWLRGRNMIDLGE